MCWDSEVCGNVGSMKFLRTGWNFDALGLRENTFTFWTRCVLDGS